jgi:hypothetical protein
VGGGTQKLQVKAASFSASVPVPFVWVTLPALALADQTPRRMSYDSSPPGLLVVPPPYLAFSALLI